MSISTYNTFSEAGLTTLADHIKAIRAKALSNEGAITGLGEDLAGLSEEVVNALAGKADSEHDHAASDVTFTDGDTFQQKYDSGELTGPRGATGNGFERVVTAGTGAAYTATVSNITTMAVGVSFIMVPHTDSTSTTATLDVNGLGAKMIVQRRSSGTGNTTTGPSSDWISSYKPIQVIYDGTYWVADLVRPDANTMYGTVPVNKGGTGATTAEGALTNLGAQAKITGTAGQFVVIGGDGNATTITLINVAEVGA